VESAGHTKLQNGLTELMRQIQWFRYFRSVLDLFFSFSRLFFIRVYSRAFAAKKILNCGHLRNLRQKGVGFRFSVPCSLFPVPSWLSGGVVLLFLLCGTLSTQQPSASSAQSAQSNQQKARAYVDRMIKALGGSAYLNLESGEFEGRYGVFYHERSEGSDVFHRFWQWPDKDRMELTKQRDIVELAVGDQLYEITFRGSRPINTQQDYNSRVYLERRRHALEIILRQWLNQPGTALFDEGTALTENHNVERITIINSSNDAVTISIDTDTNLPVKKSFVIKDPQGYRDEIGEVYDNWKMIQGVNTPYNTLVTRNGELTRQYFLSSATYNIPLQSSLFEPGSAFNIKKR
jgi:hypothetical protein